jgi:hypothetical protein
MHCPLFSSVRDLYAVSDTANLKHAQVVPSTLFEKCFTLILFQNSAKRLAILAEFFLAVTREMQEWSFNYKYHISLCHPVYLPVSVVLTFNIFISGNSITRLAFSNGHWLCSL